MTSRIRLWVDDLRPAPVGWEWAKTVTQAQYWLAHPDIAVETVSLDHDLGACDACTQAGTHIGDMQTPETTFVNTCPHAATGTTLVSWMAEHDHWSWDVPIVHSMNPVGAARMRGMIARYWHPPGTPTKR